MQLIFPALVLEDRNNSWGFTYLNFYLNTVQPISIKMYGKPDTASGTVLQKRCSRICGLKSGLIYLQKVPKNLFLKQSFLKDFSQGF